MSVWLIVPLCLVSVALLDMALRVLVLPTRVHVEVEDGAGRPGHLLVYLPGILADGSSANEVKDCWRQRAGVLMLLDYGHYRFRADYVAEILAEKIGQPSRGFGDNRFYRITVIGASMGGSVAAELIGRLRDDYDWTAEGLEVVFEDVPPSPEYFAGPGRMLSRVLSFIYAGPILSLLLKWPLRAALVLPKDDNIEEVPGEDIEAVRRRVKATAKARMSLFWFSATCDQQRCLQDPLDWAALEGIRIVYMMYVRDNETVLQPDSVEECQVHLPQLQHIVVVDSTHVGHLERPRACCRGYEEAFSYLR